MAATAACRIDVTGTVQGVGFRPFVWRLATELGVHGTVRNLGGRVAIEARGPVEALEHLVRRLRTDAPPRSRVEQVTAVPVDAATVVPADGFAVVESGTDSASERLFPPDLATCDACVGELFDPGDRRYGYPFINCTDCGPRATIIDDLPYDRQRTTMVDFPMCERCWAEYTDPADRRFHAEPVACAVCGPRLAWHTGSALVASGGNALAAAIAALGGGAIVAVKGLGGYHLACDATDPVAVRRLRERKRRWAKPFAVMVAGVDAARELACVDPAHEVLLTEPARPIVLAPVRPGTLLAAEVGLGSRDVGLFLAYTGLHHLLLAGLARPIVLTSGNLADEPIAIDDTDAMRRLAGIADGFLTHDRRIRSRYEDSVVQLVTGAPATLRRGRGYAPDPLPLPVPAAEPILAVGAQLKHTFTVATGRRAYVAAHTGDLEDFATYEAFLGNLAHLQELLDVTPAWVAHDLHPAYLSTQYAAAHDPAWRLAVQHHHAHIASCAAEHGVTDPVVGVALDGLGMGDDGTLWGGEVLIADLTGYRRVARFGRAPLPGGALAVRQPWRMALGYLYGGEFGPVDEALAAPFVAQFRPEWTSVIRRQIERRVNAPTASSAGRLFDAASAVLGIRHVSAYEADAAIALEHAADPGERGMLPARYRRVDGLAVYDPGPTLAALLAAHAAGVGVPVLAARFQRTVANAVVTLATHAAAAAGLDTVCLSGGVFANRWFTTEVSRLLGDAGLTVLRNARVPAGDGGISFGQAAVAAARLAGTEGRWAHHVPRHSRPGDRDPHRR